MPHDPDARRRYDRTRDSFEELPLQEQALFLVEATASAVARGAARASRVLADELDDFFQGASRRQRRGKDPRRDDARPDRPGPAEPPTGEQRAPGDHDGHPGGDA